MFKVTFFVPTENKEAVKNAMFDAGAGYVGNYDKCSFEVQGTGQFRPLEGSSPHKGSQDRLETVDETRVEMVCREHSTVENVIRAMKKVHPYETVAYDVVKIEKF